MSDSRISNLDPVQWHQGLLNRIETNDKCGFLRRKSSQIGVNLLTTATGTLCIGRELGAASVSLVTLQFKDSARSARNAIAHLIGVAASIVAIAAEILLFPAKIGALQNLALQKKLGLLSEPKKNEEPLETKDADKVHKDDEVPPQKAKDDEVPPQNAKDDTQPPVTPAPEMDPPLSDEVYDRNWSLAVALLRSKDQKDKAEAIQELKKLELSSWTQAYKALATLSDCYIYGNGVEKDVNIGFQYCEKAHKANPSDSYSLYSMAVLYEQGIGCTKDSAKAKAFYDQYVNLVKPITETNASELKDEQKLAYGRCLEIGLGGLKADPEAAVKLYKAVLMCRPTHPVAVARLIRCYALGVGVKQDLKEAREAAKALLQLDNNELVGLDKKKFYQMILAAHRQYPNDQEIKALVETCVERGFDKA